MVPIRRSPPLGLVLGALVGLVAYGALVVLDRSTGTLRAATTPSTVAWIGVATAGSLLAVVGLERADGPIRWTWLWLPPVVFRLVLLATDPSLSDDVYRYLWDGHLLTEGVNPYRDAISSPALDRFEIPARLMANNPDLASPYLPTTQVVFVVVALLGGGPLAMQIVMTGFDLATALVLRRLLATAELPPQRLALYLWHPLVVVESAHGAHFDALMVLLTTAALLTALRAGPHRPPGPGDRTDPVAAGRPARLRPASPILLGLAALTRPIPILLAPVLWWRWSMRQRLTLAVTLVVVLVPFRIGAGSWGLFGAPTGNGVFGSARVYAEEFRFNAVPATGLEWLTDGLGLRLSTVVGVLTVAALIVIWWWSGRTLDTRAADASITRWLLRWSMAPVVVYIVLTPVLHPWYLVIALALLVFVPPGDGESDRRWLAAAPVIALTTTLPLSYLTYEDPLRFAEREWVRRVEWWPTLVLAAVVAAVAIRGRLRRDTGPASPAAGVGD